MIELPKEIIEHIIGNALIRFPDEKGWGVVNTAPISRHGYISGRQEQLQKDLADGNFTEWTSINGWIYSEDSKTWTCIKSDMWTNYTTTELYIEYINQSKK